MPSAIDATKPADSSPALTSDLRANLLTAKNEISALQASVAAAGDFKSDGTVAMTGTITSTLGSTAVNKPSRSDTVTWTGGGTFTHEVTDITDTSSAAGSLFREWKVGGTQVVAFRKDGSLQWGSASNRVFYSAGSGGIVFDVSGSTRLVIQTGGLDIGGSNDTFLKRVSAGLAGLYTSNASATFADFKIRNGILTGNLALGIVAKTASYTVTANDGVIECDATSGAITLTLPAVAGATPGTTYTLKKTDASANAVIFDGNASETIDGATTVSTTTQHASITIIRNAAGTAWITLKD